MAGDGEMSYADVAARAGVSAGAPYRHFSSKSQLIVAVVERFFDACEEAAYVPTFEEAGDDWWSRERVRIQRIVGFFFADPLGLLVARGMVGDADVAQAQRRRLDRQAHGAARNVARGQALGLVDPHIDPLFAGAVLIGGVYHAIQVALTQGASEPEVLAARLEVFMARTLAIPWSPDATR